MEIVTLQNVMLWKDIDPNLRGETGLFFKGADLPHDPGKNCHILRKYHRVSFETYYNMLSIRSWRDRTCARDFYLRLTVRGKGVVEIQEFFQNSKEVDASVLCSQTFDLPRPETLTIRIPDTGKPMVGFSVQALDEDVCLYGGSFAAAVEPEELRDVRISIVSTTFRKEEFIAKNLRSLRGTVLAEDSEFRDSFVVNVIDNGRTLDPSAWNDGRTTVWPNPNVGGSGGFARGMIESMHMEKKPTHVLLMDDDVLIMPESFIRTCCLLRILRPEFRDWFVSGAMFDYDKRSRQYEDVGFVNRINGAYGPVKTPMNMLRLSNLLKSESISARLPEKNSYAGWWYCCIPLDKIEENGLPLPLFVRGDDVEFSLRNEARFLALNGIAIWHVGFTRKFNAATELYQVHRNSFIIQAAGGIFRDVNFFRRINTMFWKELSRYAYGNAELLLDSIDDFIRGPEFLKTLDGEQCLREHNAKNEKLSPLNAVSVRWKVNKKKLRKAKSIPFLKKIVYLITLNGHLLPNFLLVRKIEYVPFGWKFIPRQYFLRRKMIAVNDFDMTACVRTIDRRRCFALIRRYLHTVGGYRKNHASVEKAYKDAFPELISEEFWTRYLGLEK